MVKQKENKDQQSVKDASPDYVKVLAGLFLVALFLPWFVGLSTSPPGFYIDEAQGISHVICYNHFDTNSNGVTWPLFSRVEGGGFATPTYFYLLSPWTRAFGYSVFTLRLFSVFATLITLYYLFLLARKMGMPKHSMAVLMVGALSPWAFQFSRIAWDCPLAPMFFVMGLYSAYNFKSNGALFWGAVFSALAMYSYPSFRFSVPVFWLGWMLISRWRMLDMLKFALVGFVVCLPLLFALMTPEHQSRALMLSIFADHPFNPVANKPLYERLAQLVWNLLQHFDPKYLFISGDSNLRHSPPFSGQLSYFSLVVLVFFVTGLMYKSFPFFPKRIWALSLWGVVSFTFGAALNWEAIPHALRSIGAWPFFVLFVAFCLNRVLSRIPGWVFYVAAAAQFGFFHWHYYDQVDASKPWFDSYVVELANKDFKRLNELDYFEFGKFYHGFRLDMYTERELRLFCPKPKHLPIQK